MPRIIVIAVLVALTTPTFAAEGQPKIHKSAYFISMGDYHPAAPTSWASIPEPARSRIVAHLKARLGDEVYNKLTLVGGQIIDFKALRQKEPNSKDYQWEVPAYVLNLRLSLPEVGIEFYDAVIESRADGSIIKEIDLPTTGKHPERARFISTSLAFEIAKRERFDTAKAEVELSYTSDLDVCLFTFRQLTRHEGPRLFFRCVDIDAHTGRVIKVYNTGAIE